MMGTKDWIATTGGPHLLIPEEQLRHWRGSEGWFDHRDPADQSDYARACRVTTWLGSIPCHDGTAVVLSGDVGDIAWYPTAQGYEGFLVQWLGVDDERLIEPALHSGDMRKLLDSSDVEQLEFDTGLSAAMWLIDASNPGSDLIGPNQVLRLRPDRYLARAAYWESPGLIIVVRQLSWRGPVVRDDR